MSTTPPEIILASGSPRRRELLGKIGVRFEVVTADVEELIESATLSPAEIAQHNAISKASAVAKLRPDRWVLGADTIVVLGKRIFGKPANLDVAHRYLAALSGQTHTVITACCLVDPGGHGEYFYDSTSVRFHELTPETIDKYLAAVHVLDKAGGYALQEHGEWLVERVEGSRDNVLGLPTEVLRGVLTRRGLI